MTTTTPSTLAAPPTQSPLAPVAGALGKLGAVAAEDGLAAFPSADNRQFQHTIARSRLGSYVGLFLSLRARHAPTATHSLRVALAASSWAEFARVDADIRDTLETAALLHDLGKLGIADAILLKPARLTGDEASVISQQRMLGAEILAGCGAPHEVIDTILTTPARFDGKHRELPLVGEQIPLAARMLAIVDAFDSMTTDHVYRPARSREAALAELLAHAGTQFDPQLVQSFAALVAGDQTLLLGRTASRWLKQLAGDTPTGWGSPAILPGASGHSAGSLFQQKLIENMLDGVVFVDQSGRITGWNVGAQRLTGVAPEAAIGKQFAPSLMQMSHTSGKSMRDSECPLARAISTGVPALERVEIVGRAGHQVQIDLHVLPVIDAHLCHGATVLLRDATSEVSLEEKCQAMHAQMTLDPMTQVANRAEFDRMLALFVDAHQETALPCSLIMADIDHFKHINDTFGHQAGDAAIIAFARLLKGLCRAGDLVARYGGEEFAVLCADCSNAAAAARAEQIRRKIAETTHPMLANHRVTASFGVTELQAGDTAESMLRRADRALLEAKDQGRNQVVQLGNAMATDTPKRRWWNFNPWASRAVIETRLSTNVPIDVAIEKLRGFISDHHAKLLKVDDEEVRLEMSDEGSIAQRRRGDHAVTFHISIKFSQSWVEKTNASGLAAGRYAVTKADVSIRPRRDRDRRRGQATERARMVLASLRSYLMASEEVAEPTGK